MHFIWEDGVWLHRNPVKDQDGKAGTTACRRCHLQQ
jgi:hypothetical protein